MKKKKLLNVLVFLMISVIGGTQNVDSCIVLSQCNQSFDPWSLHPPEIKKNTMDNITWDLSPCIIRNLRHPLIIDGSCLKGTMVMDSAGNGNRLNSCNNYNNAGGYPRAYCVLGDSAVGTIIFRLEATEMLNLKSFQVHYFLPLENINAGNTPASQNDPNNIQELVLKIYDGSNLIKTIVHTILSRYSRDTAWHETFDLSGVKLNPGGSYHIEVFGRKPIYANRTNSNPLWDFFGFKLDYECVTIVSCQWQGPVNRHPSKQGCQEIDYWSWWSVECGDYVVKVVRPIDSIAPTMVCRTSVVALNAPCIDLPAYALNAGSQENCGVITFSARRMGEPTLNNYIKLCCDDVGKFITIVLRGSDPCGNFNECMVEVEVQDKTPPGMTCPSDLSVECSQLDTSNWDKFGNPIVWDYCSFSIKEKREYNLNTCGLGTITRTWTATDGSGNTAMCSQIITVVNSQPFNVNNIIWPRDTTIDCGPSSMIDPNKLGRPKFVNLNHCMMPLMSYEDQVFIMNKGSSCSKIVRVWTVIDWCQSISKNWTYVQIIEIIDKITPTINCPSDVMFESYAGCNNPIMINLPDVTTTDNCSKVVLIHNNSPYADKAMGNASGKYPPGTHKVVYMAIDECGNTSTCNQTIVVVDKKPPTVFCVGVRTTLQAMPGMGIVQSIWAKDLIHKIESPCCLINDIKVSFDSLGTINQKWFDCSNIGQNYICVWVTDCKGNQTKCCNWVDIQDNSNLCPPTFKPDSITLKVCTQHWLCAKPIDGVELKPWGYTDQNGCISIKLPKGAKIDLKASFDDEYISDVTTADIVEIRKYILGKDSLNFYQKIATDVNKSLSITTADIVEIRKLILGVADRFKYNNWVFLPDSILLNLNQDTIINFIGVKLGDINGSWCSRNANNSTSRGNISPQNGRKNLKDPFTVIPNPTTGSFTVISNKDEEWQMFSIDGILLHQEKTNTEINLMLSPGLYFIQIGNNIKKVIIQ